MQPLPSRPAKRRRTVRDRRQFRGSYYLEREGRAVRQRSSKWLVYGLSMSLTRFIQDLPTGAPSSKAGASGRPSKMLYPCYQPAAVFHRPGRTAAIGDDELTSTVNMCGEQYQSNRLSESVSAPKWSIRNSLEIVYIITAFQEHAGPVRSLQNVLHV